MTQVLNGVVRGKTVVLEDDPHLAEGEKVRVSLRPLKSKKKATPGEGIRRSAGAWADHPEMDEIMAEIQRLRKNSTRPEVNL